MSQSPRLRRYLSIVAHSANEVELRTGVWNPTSITLTDGEKTGKLLGILTLLDGTRTLSEIARVVGVTRAQIEGVIDQLVAGRLIEEQAETALDRYLDQAAGVLHSPGDPPEPRGVAILGANESSALTASIVAESLGADAVTEIGPSDERWRVLTDRDQYWLADSLAFEERLRLFEPLANDILVLVQDVVNPFVARALNRVALKIGATALFSALDGPFIFVGPSVRPNGSPCFECFETRVMMNLRELASYQRYKLALARGDVTGARFTPQTPVNHLLATHTAMEAVNLAMTGNAFTTNKVLGIYLPTMEIVYNDLLRVAQCSACGSERFRDDSEIYFDLGALLSEWDTAARRPK